MLFKLSNLNSNPALTLGYLNPALNNSAQSSSKCQGSIVIWLLWRLEIIQKNKTAYTLEYNVLC